MGFLIKLVCLCSRNMILFLKLVLHDVNYHYNHQMGAEDVLLAHISQFSVVTSSDLFTHVCETEVRCELGQ